MDKKYSRTKSKVNETEKKYWNIYLDVERLTKIDKCSKTQACRALEEKYKMTYKTIRTRYKDKQTYVNKNNISIKDILEACGYL